MNFLIKNIRPWSTSTTLSTRRVTSRMIGNKLIVMSCLSTVTVWVRLLASATNSSYSLPVTSWTWSACPRLRTSRWLRPLWQLYLQFYCSGKHPKTCKESKISKAHFSSSAWTSRSTPSRMSFSSSLMKGLCSYAKWTTTCTAAHPTSGQRSSLSCPSLSSPPACSALSFTSLSVWVKLMAWKSSAYSCVFWLSSTTQVVATLSSFPAVSLTSSWQLRSRPCSSFPSCSSQDSSYLHRTFLYSWRSSNTSRSSSMDTTRWWWTNSKDTMTSVIFPPTSGISLAFALTRPLPCSVTPSLRLRLAPLPILLLLSEVSVLSEESTSVATWSPGWSWPAFLLNSSDLLD